MTDTLIRQQTILQKKTGQTTITQTDENNTPTNDIQTNTDNEIPM